MSKTNKCATYNTRLNYICMMLNVDLFGVAVLLNVTPGRVDDLRLADRVYYPKATRGLNRLYKIIRWGIENGVDASLLFNFLNEPIGDSGKTLLYYIVDGTQMQFLYIIDYKLRQQKQ